MKNLKAVVIAAVATCTVAAPVHGENGKKSSITPPVISHSVICENPFAWTLRLSILDDIEVAFYAIQPQGSFGLNNVVSVEPGLQVVEMDLTGNAVGRTLLLLASDMEGNIAKDVVTVPPDYCGCLNCE